MNLILTPGSPGFYDCLQNPIIAHQLNGGRDQYYVVDAESGLLRPATERELTEYLEGGEYDEVMEHALDMGADWD